MLLTKTIFSYSAIFIEKKTSESVQTIGCGQTVNFVVKKMHHNPYFVQ